jgi:integrase
MASVIQKPSGMWRAQVRHRGYPTQSKTFRTRANAEQWGRMIESEMDRGDFVDRHEAENNTFADLLNRYLQEVTPLKKGQRTERYRIAKLLADPMACIRAIGLTPQIVAEYRDRRLACKKASTGQAIAGTTVKRELELISNVINVARREWGVNISNPVENIRKPRCNRARTRRLCTEEERQLFAAIEPVERNSDGTYPSGGCRNPWVKPIVLVALETAMRRSELLALRWRDIDLAQCYARLHDSKNGEARDVPLTEKALEVLSQLPRETDQVFPISDESLKQAFERAVRRAGLVDFRFHDLRHEATSRLAEVLDNVLDLSSVTGHKTVQMLKRYYHPRAKDIAAKINQRRRERV